MGGQTLGISGDKAIMEVDIATNMGIKTFIQDFLILEHVPNHSSWKFNGIHR